MYRHVTLRFHQAPIPLVRLTRTHGVRLIAHPLRREPDSPLATEHLFVARGAPNVLDLVEKSLVAEGHPPRVLDCNEPGVRLLQGSMGMPRSGPMRGILSVLQDSLGCIVEQGPLILEQGVLTAPLITVPGPDSTLRLQAIKQHPAAAQVGLEVPPPRSVAAFPVVVPPDPLDLLEWDVLKALESAGCFDEPPRADRTQVLDDLSDELQIPTERLDALADAAARRLLQAQVQARRENIRLTTLPPSPAPSPSGPHDEG